MAFQTIQDIIDEANRSLAGQSAYFRPTFETLQGIDPELDRLRKQYKESMGTSSSERDIIYKNMISKVSTLSGAGQIPEEALSRTLGRGAGMGFGEAGGLGAPELEKAKEGAELLKERYVDEDPYGPAVEKAAAGIRAGEGRRAELERERLRASLSAMGPGVSAVRRMGERQRLESEIATRSFEAEGKIGELELMAADKGRMALEDYIGTYMKFADLQRSMWATYWGMTDKLRGGTAYTLGKRRTQESIQQPGGLGGLLGIYGT